MAGTKKGLQLLTTASPIEAQKRKGETLHRKWPGTDAPGVGKRSVSWLHCHQLSFRRREAPAALKGRPGPAEQLYGAKADEPGHE